MPRPSMVIVLVEDQRHEMLVRRYLRKRGMERHQITVIPFPSGKGSAEQWVRTRFAKEVGAYRRRTAGAKAATALVVTIDADSNSVDKQLAHLERGLVETGMEPVAQDEQ